MLSPAAQPSAIGTELVRYRSSPGTAASSPKSRTRRERGRIRACPAQLRILIQLRSHAQIAADAADFMKLLVVEDDRETSAYLAKGLGESGYVVDRVGDGREGLFLASSGDYDAIILDRMLPAMDGLAMLGALRAAEIRTPALILSALGSVDDRVRGLRAGGDDYLVKPFESDDLLMRSRLAIQNYLRPSAGNGISVGSLSIDVEACVVYIDGDQVELTPAEYRLLGILADRTDNVVTGHRLLEDLWGPLTNHRNLRCLSILVRDLRERIEPRPHRPRVVREFRSVIVLLNAETPQLPQSTIPCESVNARAKDARLGSKELVQGVYPLRSS